MFFHIAFIGSPTYLRSAFFFAVLPFCTLTEGRTDLVCNKNKSWLSTVSNRTKIELNNIDFVELSFYSYSCLSYFLFQYF